MPRIDVAVVNQSDLQKFQAGIERFANEGYACIGYQIVQPTRLAPFTYSPAIHCAIMQRTVVEVP